MELSADLLEAAERKLAKLDAFLDESGWIEIGFVEEKNPRIADKYHCEIVAHLKGHRLKVEGSAADPLGAIDRAADKVERQVVRLKDKRVKRRLGRRSGGLSEAGANGASANGGAPVVSSGVRERLPSIVDRTEVDAKPMTPVEAAMQLELLGTPFLLFHNAESGRAAVVYRHRGADYGLVEMPG
ncbi:MAG TPA: ribosome-associated translation inhibitor RaiA [Acidimicrobiia bacterium]|nr:ribosome-associated translation inhibitor RaiA [Acidimicrobiia bacterium]